MSRTYRIHPAIGVARLGNSPSFFVAAETLFGTPYEIIDGQEVPVQKFKDPQGRVKKQAARFRIFEYEDGTPLREITGDDAEIVWSVRLANTKGSANKAPLPNDQRRNANIADRDSLNITPGERAITGRNQASGPMKGKFLRTEVALGELRTDGAGRLIVLGADGISAGDRPLQTSDIFNNDGWYDDVADGPVNARIRLNGSETYVTADGAWVLTNSPDFAPEIDPWVTLYDVAYDVAVLKGWLQLPESPSFRNDIYPILYPAAQHRWVERNQKIEKLEELTKSWKDLSDPSKPRKIREEIEEIVTAPGFSVFSITDSQAELLAKWVDGQFTNDWNDRADLEITPAGLDRAHLARTTGSGFFPGIEASRYFAERQFYPNFYRAPFRIANDVKPGALTERMSLPWQSDYAACRQTWWPAQRPNWIRISASTTERRVWTNFGGTEMVAGYRRLGFIVPTVDPDGRIVFVESEREPGTPYGTLADLVEPTTAKLSITEVRV
ncbi:MAG TPA: LodA/GoxA family CTQ-dependent oxidase [Vicinamibacterales bacterium]